MHTALILNKNKKLKIKIEIEIKHSCILERKSIKIDGLVKLITY